MYPKYHALLGILFCIILYLFSIDLIPIMLVFLSSVLIDFDHFLFYMVRKRNANPITAYFWHKSVREKDRYHKPMMHIFHTLEFMLIVGILSMFFPFFMYIFTGVIFHSLIDFIDLSLGKRISAREYSLIRYLLEKNKKKYY